MGPSGEVADRPYRCGSRLCDSCGRTLAAKWYRITATGYELDPKNVRFVTFTCAPYFNTDRAWGAFPVLWNNLRRSLEREWGPFEYIRAVEATKAGRPHYHLLVRGPYWPVRRLSALADREGFGRVVWITRPRDRRRAARYVLKYLLKDVHLPLQFKQRRVSRSQGWVVDVPRETLPGWAWELVQDWGLDAPTELPPL